MRYAALQRQVLSEVSETLPQRVFDRPIVLIETHKQSLQLISVDDEIIFSCPISTSKYGLGQANGSYQTPAGIHRIAQKIGAGQDLGRVFRGRIATDEVCLPEHYDGRSDVITSRILWLDGLQQGHNRGGEVDTHERYIYIHGTADEARIGEPASIGCVRVKNLDVIRLFDLTQVDDLVVIQ